MTVDHPGVGSSSAGVLVFRGAPGVVLAGRVRNFRKIMGHQQLWILKAYLDEPTQQEEKIAEERRVV